jgi:hypothetical protein
VSDAIARRSELLRLGRLLGVDAGALGFLDDVDPAVLRDLRLALADRLLARNRRAFERAVALADLVPVALAARLAEHALGPVLGGRAASLLSPKKAAELAERLPPDFLGDVAQHLDLRRAGPLLQGIPVETMAATAAHLREREEWIVLGAFVGHIDDEQLDRLLGGLDGEALLRAGFVVEEPERLDAVVRLLSDARLDELIDAAETHDLWREAVALTRHVSVEQRRRVTDAIARSSEHWARDLAGRLSADAELLEAAGPLIEGAPELRAALEQRTR